jgi:hypothetical protein
MFWTDKSITDGSVRESSAVLRGNRVGRQWLECCSRSRRRDMCLTS